MAHSLADIEKEVTQLPPDARERLIRVLIDSLEPADEGDIAAAWEQEVFGRSEEIRKGTVEPASADEALARVRGTLR